MDIEDIFDIKLQMELNKRLRDKKKISEEMFFKANDVLFKKLTAAE